MKYMGSMIKVRNLESVKQNLRSTNKQRPNLPRQFGCQTNQGGAQPAAHHAKAVARGASQGAAAPWVHPHPQCRLSCPPSPGWYNKCSIGDCMRDLHGIFSETTLDTGIRGGGEPPLSTHTPFGASTSFFTCTLLLLVVIWSKAKLPWRA